VAVSGLPANSYATSVSVGALSACAIVQDGVQCWGDNSRGELGNGTTSTTPSPTPVWVSGLPAGHGVEAVAVGFGFVCAEVWSGVQCWGQPYGSTPTQIPSLPAGSVVTGVAAGDDFACAISWGLVQCWGSNARGQLGNRYATLTGVLSSDVPVTVDLPLTADESGFDVKAISAKGQLACALLKNGDTLCWGDNTHGQLGPHVSATSSDAPVVIPIPR
jgi:alpha-tubulin suppressor-like RCC1 family protein